MSTVKTPENQTKKLFLQKLVDGCIVVLISSIILKVYEGYWTSVHSSKEALFAISFDMFSVYYVFVSVLLIFIAPNIYEIIISKKLTRKYTTPKQLPSKLLRFLTILVVTIFISLCSLTFADKYSRVEFYTNGNIVEYNRHNEIENQYTEADIDFVELRTNNSLGKMTSYWTEAVFNVKYKKFILTSENYITALEYDVNYETEKSLYGLKTIKENFSDKIKIKNEKIHTLLRVESTSYTQHQAKELCDIFEVDYNEAIAYLGEWDIVLDSTDE